MIAQVFHISNTGANTCVCVEGVMVICGMWHTFPRELQVKREVSLCVWVCSQEVLGNAKNHKSTVRASPFTSEMRPRCCAVIPLWHKQIKSDESLFLTFLLPLPRENHQQTNSFPLSAHSYQLVYPRARPSFVFTLPQNSTIPTCLMKTWHLCSWETGSPISRQTVKTTKHPTQ